MTPSFWVGRRVLVTGHTGFKGAWLTLWLERLGAELAGLALPPESPDGAFSAFQPWTRLDSHMADLRDLRETERAVAAVMPEIVFHLGAQALVRQGWVDAPDTYAVNVLGTAHVLEAVSRARCVRAVVVVTSDKVYMNVGTRQPFREDSPLGGGDPYSASKAAAELVVGAWRNGNPNVPVTTVRAGNVVGGGDTSRDRLLPDAWRALQTGHDLVLRHPTAIRPWQFVLEPLAGYLQVAEHLIADPSLCPAAVNFGPSQTGCWSVADVADAVLATWGGGGWIDGQDPADPPESQALRLHSGLATSAFGWQPHLDLDTAIRWTVAWWREAEKGGSLRSLATDQIEAYEDLIG